MMPRPPSSTLFPYTTLFRSGVILTSGKIILPPVPSHHNPYYRDMCDGRWTDREPRSVQRSEEHTSELQSLRHLVCRLLLEKKNNGERHHDAEGRTGL